MKCIYGSERSFLKVEMYVFAIESGGRALCFHWVAFAQPNVPGSPGTVEATRSARLVLPNAGLLFSATAV